VPTTANPTFSPTIRPTVQEGFPTEAPTVAPSGQPSSMPSSPFPSGKPSSAPTDIASSLFDARLVLEDYMAAVTDNPIIFTTASNVEADFIANEAPFSTFTANAFSSPLDIDYFAVGFYNEWFDSVDQILNSTSIFCRQSDLANQFAAAIKAGDDLLDMVCDGHTFSYLASGYSCVDCTFDSTNICSSTNILQIVPSPSECSPWLLGRVASAFKVESAIIPPPGIPEILSVVTTAKRTSLVVDVSLRAFTTGGTLYCAAFLFSLGTSTITVGEIKSKGISLWVQSAVDNSTLAAQVTIPSLVPFTYYNVLCHTENVNGVGDAVATALSFKQDTFTECCREITFTNAPVFVLNDVTGYTSEAFTEYVFSYKLQAAPDFSLKVTPTLYKFEETNGVFVNDSGTIQVGALSESTTLYESSSSLSSSFVLESVASITTTTFDPTGTNVSYVIELVPTGEDEFMYDGASYMLTVGNADSEPPAPIILTAVISNSGGGITVTFDSETDQMANNALVTSSSFTCSAAFEFSGADLCTCQFTSLSVVKITFPSRSQITSTTTLVVADDTIVMKANALKAICTKDASICDTYSYAPSSTVTVTAPATPTIPVARFNLPATISSCEDLTVDVSGSTGAAGRSFASISMQVSASSADTDVTFVQGNVTEALQTVGIGTPYVISNAALNFTTYTFILTLVNWLGEEGVASASATVSSEGDLPTLSFVGGGAVTFAASDTVIVDVKGKLSSCTRSTSISYSDWVVYDDYVFVSGLTSNSVNRKRFKVAPYTLSAGKTYQIQITGTTNLGGSATVLGEVFIEFGEVIALISGGASRQNPVTSALVLDGSGSLDLSFATTDQTDRLLYEWACVEMAFATFGTSCADKINDITASTISVAADSLLEDNSYQFTLTVFSNDDTAREDSSVTTVKISAGNTPIVLTTTTTVKFNPNDQFNVNGLITADLSTSDIQQVTAFWNVSDFTDISTMLNQASVKTFTNIANLQAGVTFPLKFIEDSFTAGQTYTFTLTAYISPLKKVSATMSSVVNSPPSSGSFDVTPSTGGIASGANSSTLFFFTVPDWLDDFSDLPLSYEILYFMVDIASGTFSVQSKTQNSLAYTNLPPGLASAENKVFCFAYVYDNLNSFTTTDTVHVESKLEEGTSETEAVANALGSGLTAALGTGDSDSVNNLVSNGASTLSTVNCNLTSATQCDTDYNRAACSLTAQTCGSCLTGFTGVSGDANSVCEPTDSRRRLAHIERILTTNPNCPTTNTFLYDASDPNCAPFSKTCPSDTADPCSGRGTCGFYDISGNEISNCTVVQSSCTAKCTCDTGYGGKTCGFTDAEIASRLNSRASMCDAIVFSAGLQDESESLLSIITSSMESVYSADEVVSVDSIASCTNALNIIYELLTKDLLGTSNTVAGQVLNTISKFTDTLGASPNSINSTFSALLVDVVDELVKNVANNMVVGQNFQTFTTSNLQLTVYSEFVADSASTLEPPANDISSLLALPSTHLVLPDGGWSQCSSGSDEIAYSILQWGQNPYLNSSALESPLLHIHLLDATAVDTTESSTYSIVFQFNSEQTSSMNVSDVYSNRTIPEAVTRTADDVYSNETGCTVVAYTAFNVTLECSDVRNLCSSSSTSSISNTVTTLKNKFNNIANTYDYATFSLKGGVEIVKMEPDERRLYEQEFARRLADDDAGADPSPTKQYAMILNSAAAVVVDTIATDPTDFAVLVNTKAGLEVLIFIASVVVSFVIGLIFFARWDETDRIYLTYVQNAMQYAAASMVEADGAAKGALSRAFSSNQVRTKTSSLGNSGRRIGDGDDDDEGPLIGGETLVDTEVESNYSPQGESFIGVVFKGSSHSSVVEKGQFWSHFGKTVLREQMFLSSFTFASTFNPRFYRWMGMYVELLLEMAIVATFFSVFFPAGVDCAQHDTKAACEDVIVSATQEPQCIFSDSSGECSVNEPSETPAFYLVLTLAVGTVMLPLLLFILTMVDFCKCRPDFREYDKWPWYYVKYAILGKETNENITDMQERPSLLKGVMGGDTKMIKEGLHALKKDVKKNVKTSVKTAKRASISLAEDMHKDLKSGLDLGLKDLDAGVKKVRRASLNAMSKLGIMKKKSKHVNTGTKFTGATMKERLSHVSSLSPRKEARLIVEDSVDYLDKLFGSIAIPWYVANDNSGDDDHLAAIQMHLKMYPDGQLMPVSWFEFIVYGYRNPMDRLEKKIAFTRKKAQGIEEMLDEFSLGETDLKDKMLLQAFILENLSYLDGIALKRSFFQMDYANPPRISVGWWLFAWFCVISEILFCLYFALAWSVNNDPATRRAFFIAFVLGVLQDQFFFDPMRIFFNFSIPLATMKPQLRKIYQVLNNIMSAVKDEDDDTSQTDLQIVQFLSASCRAARSATCSALPGAHFLMQLTDADSEKCLMKGSQGRHWLLSILLAAPAFYLMFGELRGDEVFDVVIQSFYTFWMLINDILYQFSPALLFLIYAGILVYVGITYGVLEPMRQRVLKENRAGDGERLWGMFNKGDELYWETSLIDIFTTVSLYRRYVAKMATNGMRAYLNYSSNGTERNMNRIWKNMNKPYHSQVCVLSEAEWQHYDRLSEGNAILVKNGIIYPDFIEDMRSSTVADKLKAHRKGKTYTPRRQSTATPHSVDASGNTISHSFKDRKGSRSNFLSNLMRNDDDSSDESKVDDENDVVKLISKRMKTMQGGSSNSIGSQNSDEPTKEELEARHAKRLGRSVFGGTMQDLYEEGVAGNANETAKGFTRVSTKSAAMFAVDKLRASKSNTDLSGSTSTSSIVVAKSEQEATLGMSKSTSADNVQGSKLKQGSSLRSLFSKQPSSASAGTPGDLPRVPSAKDLAVANAAQAAVNKLREKTAAIGKPKPADTSPSSAPQSTSLVVTGDAEASLGSETATSAPVLVPSNPTTAAILSRKLSGLSSSTGDAAKSAVDRLREKIASKSPAASASGKSSPSKLTRGPSLQLTTDEPAPEAEATA